MNRGRAGWLVLRLLVTAGLLAWVIRSIDLGALGQRVLGSRWGLLAAMAAVLPATFVVLAARWKLLLEANGISIPFRRVLSVTWAGIFFNQVLPGASGGDVARAVLAAQGEERKAAIAGTVLLDRVVGLLAMIVMAVAVMIPVSGRPELRPIVLLVAGLGAGAVLGFVAYFSPVGRAVRGRLPFKGVVDELHKVLSTLKDSRGTMIKAGLLSAVAQGLTILAIVGIARALRMDAVPVGAFFLVEPIIFIVTAVPVSMGGWGVQEWAYQLLFRPYGVAPTEAAALSVVYKLVLIAASLPGGLLFALGGRRKS